MAYKLSPSKSKKVSEQIDVDGQILDINVNVAKTSLHFNEAYNNVLRLQNVDITSDNVVEQFEQLGNAVIELLEVILGKKQTETLINAYDEDYIQLLEDIVPFIDQKIKPAMIEYSKEKQRIAAEKYKQNKIK